MEFFQPPMAINFSRCHLLLKVFQIHQTHNLSNIKLQSTQQFIALTLMAMIGMQLINIVYESMQTLKNVMFDENKYIKTIGRRWDASANEIQWVNMIIL